MPTPCLEARWRIHIGARKVETEQISIWCSIVDLKMNEIEEHVLLAVVHTDRCPLADLSNHLTAVQYSIRIHCLVLEPVDFSDELPDEWWRSALILYGVEFGHEIST